MPRNYNINDNTGGTNMVGRAYTPQVAPWNRDDDDVSVRRSLRDDPQEWRDRRDDRDMRSLDREYDYRRRDRYGREPDAYYRRDLVPGYGDDRAGYSADHEREDRHRAGHRKHWENREPDYRYQYNDYQRTDEREIRRDNQARYARQEDAGGYRSRNDRDGWMSRERSDHGREDYDRDRYNDRERYYARNDEDRSRWNRR
jgi:hypothetical protein